MAPRSREAPSLPYLYARITSSRIISIIMNAPCHGRPGGAYNRVITLNRARFIWPVNGVVMSVPVLVYSVQKKLRSATLYLEPEQ